MTYEIEKYCISREATLRDAMKIVDAGAKRIAIVKGDHNELVGVISDGDIRRAMLSGLEMSDSISGVINTSPITCTVGDSIETVIDLAIENNVYQIPIVTKDNILVGLDELREVLRPTSYANSVVLMVGGLGSRLRPLTEDVPKPMLEVGGKPILETILDRFKRHGFKNFYLCVNYMAEMIQDYFGNGADMGVSIEYVRETDRKGTAGALSYLKNQLEGDFFVMNGDLLTSTNFEHFLQFHQNNKAVATMGVRNYEFEVPYGVVNIENEKFVGITEKPRHKFFVNTGIYILNSAVLQYVPDNCFYDMPTLFQKLLDKEATVQTFPLREYWIDIGHINELNRAKKEYSGIFND